ncbi:EexN family lipoprotein [Campylobacter concisus]|uniref:EexN family lipoprotein n=1 Tax=Campylobacter concisus TaxID=199 RepID=UPI0011E65D13|nr:EexN family lipoprotein [Campylobacter concisus]
MKRSILVIALSALLIGVLSGCGGEETKKVEEPKTAKYYKDHIDETIKTYADCVRNNHYRDEGYNSIKVKNCKNASIALDQKGMLDEVYQKVK